MAAKIDVERTHFTLDVLGRDTCNTVAKALTAMNETSQTFSLRPARPAGEWNDYEIRVQGSRFTVTLNGEQVTEFTGTDPARGQPSTPAAPTYVGLQIHPGSRMAFLNIEHRAI